MKKQQYLLDTNVLVKRPRLLARLDAAERFLIPVAAIERFSNRENGTDVEPLNRVLSAASAAGVELIDASKTRPPFLPSSQDFRLDAYDLAILGTLLELRNDQTRSVYLVTEDKTLRKAATQNGFEAISLDELVALLDREPRAMDAPINVQVGQQVDKYEKSERSNIQKAALIGVAAITIAAFIRYSYKYIFLLLTSAPGLLIGVIACAFGGLLYWFRLRYRATYGMVEMFIGAWISVNAFPLDSVLDAAVGLQMLGGLYVVVRGLDNVGSGVKGTRYEPNWRRIFG